MGQYLGKSLSENSALPAQCTPLPVRRHARVLTLSELDPRSPTAEITRTPIQMEASSPSDSLTEVGDADAQLDPRSPTNAFQRTPIPLGTIFKRRAEPESPTFLVREKMPVPESVSPQGTTTLRERRLKRSQENTGGTKKQSQSITTPPMGERPALKSTSRPNTLLRSLQENTLQRAGKANFYSPKARNCSDDNKENGVVPASA